MILYDSREKNFWKSTYVGMIFYAELCIKYVVTSKNIFFLILLHKEKFDHSSEPTTINFILKGGF
jgi:hypothetical protein